MIAIGHLSLGLSAGSLRPDFVPPPPPPPASWAYAAFENGVLVMDWPEPGLPALTFIEVGENQARFNL